MNWLNIRFALEDLAGEEALISVILSFHMPSKRKNIDDTSDDTASLLLARLLWRDIWIPRSRYLEASSRSRPFNGNHGLARRDKPSVTSLLKFRFRPWMKSSDAATTMKCWSLRFPFTLLTLSMLEGTVTKMVWSLTLNSLRFIATNRSPFSQ